MPAQSAGGKQLHQRKQSRAVNGASASGKVGACAARGATRTEGDSAYRTLPPLVSTSTSRSIAAACSGGMGLM